MKNKHDIDTYFKLAEAISFYLRESFNYLSEALINEYALIIFSKEIDKIDPTDEDKRLMKNIYLPDSLIGVLQAHNVEPISDKTLNRMVDVWSIAQQTARVGQHTFGHQHEINSIQILGHLNNFGFFIETLINRHLLFLNHSNEIDNFSYSRIITARTIDRLIYVFKEELKHNKTQINEIIHLFSLRNKTVHYTPDNAQSLKPKLSELLQIWKQARIIIEKFELKEKFNDEKFSEQLYDHINIITKQWM